MILLEDYLASEFKFGFELEAFFSEGWIPSEGYYDNEDYDNEDEYFTDDRRDASLIHKELEDILAKAFQFSNDEVSIKSDGSLEADDEWDYPFEWATPVMKFTPLQIKKCLNGLNSIFKNKQIYTNNTCGFHIHFSFPNISDKEVIWVICKLAMDKKMRSRIEKFKGIDFFNDTYADKSFLEQIRQCIDEKDFNNLVKYFGTDKYRSIHIHPQGTIEWRGPRNFLNEYEINKTKQFFILLHDFIMWVSKSISSDDLDGMTKNNFFKLLYGEDYKEGELIANFNATEKSKKTLNKIKLDIQNNDPDLIIKILNMYSKVKNSNIQEFIIKYFSYLNMNDYMFDNIDEYYKMLGKKLTENNLIDVAIKYMDASVMMKIFNNVSEENRYTILAQIANQHKISILTNILERAGGSNLRMMSIAKFIQNYQDKLSSSFFKYFFQHLPYILKYGEDIYQEEIFSKKPILDLLDDISLTYNEQGDISYYQALKLIEVAKKNIVLFKIVKESFEDIKQFYQQKYKSISDMRPLVREGFERINNLYNILLGKE